MSLHKVWQKLIKDPDLRMQCSSRFIDDLSNCIGDPTSEFSYKVVPYLLDQCWISLHAIHFSKVPEIWRSLYTLLCYLSSQQTKDLKKKIYWLDMAFIMTGAPILKEEIYLLTAQYQQQIKNQFDFQIPIVIQIKNFEIKRPIQRLKSIDISTLLEFTSKRLPFVLEGGVSHLKAVEKWKDLEYLLRLIGPDRLVPVEIGNSYTDEEWTQKIMTLFAFYKNHLSSKEERKGYVAQVDLLSQFPQLQNDLEIPEFCYFSYPNKITQHISEMKVHCWFGPEETKSPLHHDPYDNFYTQIVGWKYLRLYAPGENVLPFTEGLMTNTSLVKDIFNPPGEFSKNYLETILKPGDLM